ncbi:hypothetical protein DY000_02029361 [Brassica cretica]|uniref:Uncharacterized protein n=1 Tax=Brassica cretica TaxID=69181 RepID=A0ABQ7DZC2_BRACR|nr:hypothetical protein DY000_02029361 [Brassica cretica]
MDLLLSNQAKQEQMNFVGGPSQEVPPKVNEVDGLEGQEELCFINNNGTCQSKTLSKGAISLGKTSLLVSAITAISLLKLKEVLHKLQLQIQVLMQCSRNS